MIKTGTLESSDCMIELKESNELKIEIESIVFEQFGEQIYEVLKTTLDEYGVKTVFLRCIDKGALDYTIKARLKTALELWGVNHG